MLRQSPEPMMTPPFPRRRHFITRTAVASLLISLLVSSAVLGQSGRAKWGKVSKAELEMKDFPADTNAAAVVLSDYGETYFSDKGTMVYERHRRIKILSEAGYDWATFEAPYYAKRRIQTVRKFEGQTFNLSPNGKIKKTKLDKKSIFDEDIDGRWRRKKATLPALQPGSVIEYRYIIESENPRDISGWTFQTSEPVLWSEYRIWVPAGFRYTWVAHGVEEKLPTAESHDEVRFGTMGSANKWIMTNVPALRREPYMTTPKDYRARIQVQLAEIIIPGVISRDFTKTWEQLSKELLDSRYFGKQLNRGNFLPENVKAEIEQLPTPKEKLIAVHDYLQEHVKWNEFLGLYSSGDVKDAFNKRVARGSDITFMLISILREYGIEADPVIISTRSHGKLQQIYPILEQFNHVIAAVKIDGKQYFLDPRGSHRPYELLPLSDLNQLGFLVHKIYPRWVKITAKGKYKHEISVKASVDPDGNVTGKFRALYSEYGGVRERNSLHGEDEGDYVVDLLDNDMPEVAVDSFEVENVKDVTKPLVISANFSTPGYAQAAGDLIYINPILVDRSDENPFKLAERKFPVDFGYQQDQSYTLSLEIPEGYAIEELPQNRLIRLRNRGGELRRTVQEDGRSIQLSMRFKINQTIFQPESYQALRRFFDQVVATEAEQIVLKRTPQTTQTSRGEN